MTKLASKERLFFIADEVHHLGAEEFGEVMSWCDPGLGKVGLSATPRRVWDVAGTERILDYFGGIVYEYGIGQAIEDGILSKYRYYPEFVSLEREEMEEYMDLTEQIARRVAILTSSSEENLMAIDDERLQTLFNRRATIVKTAGQKVPKALEILMREKPKRCLVYFDRETQIDELAALLERRGLSFSVYTSNVKGREISMERFSKGHVDVLLAIGCLDEGIDIPWCKNALIVASSSNSAEFIQRRGRILRKHPQKDYARIFDIGVLPFDPEKGPPPTIKLSGAEISILRRELNRIEVFLADAENAVEQYPKIMKIRKMFSRVRKK